MLMLQNVMAILLLLVGPVVLGFGIRILFRRRATVLLSNAKNSRQGSIILKMTGGRALLFGAAITVLGLRIITAYVLAWMEQGSDLKEVAVAGSVTTWAFVAILVSVVWHISSKARSFFTSPEFKKVIPDIVKQAMEERDKDR
jgi:hypothetical protein